MSDTPAWKRALLSVLGALDFLQGRKTKIGAFIVLVGKVIGRFEPDMGELVVTLGEWFALYGLALVAVRVVVPPPPGAAPPIDPMPEQKLAAVVAKDKPRGARTGTP